jgi:hypothetical protein
MNSKHEKTFAGMKMNWRKNALIRKSAKYMMCLPRAVERLKASKSDYEHNPPVIINSFPKSGTHLLLQIAQAFPGVHDWGNFAASLGSSFFYHKVNESTLCGKLRRLAPGELCGGHIFYSEQMRKTTEQTNAVHLFIYRDPRDVAVSEAYYLTNMNKWHRLSKYFRNLPDMQSRIMFAIAGGREADFSYYYPDIKKRFADYQNWLSDGNTLAVRYEDLISERRPEVVREIVKFYLKKSNADVDQDYCVRSALDNINPNKSHTYRKGKKGGWRNEFTDEHKKAFKEIAGDLLIGLKYEKDSDW